MKNFWMTLYSNDNFITTEDVYRLLCQNKKTINTRIVEVIENTPMFVTEPRSGKQKEMIDLVQTFDKLTRTTVQPTDNLYNFEKLKEWLSKLKFKDKFISDKIIILI